MSSGSYNLIWGDLDDNYGPKIRVRANYGRSTCCCVRISGPSGTPLFYRRIRQSNIGGHDIFQHCWRDLRQYIHKKKLEVTPACLWHFEHPWQVTTWRDRGKEQLRPLYVDSALNISFFRVTVGRFSYRSKAAQAYMVHIQWRKRRVLYWPPKSPDLNSIKNVVHH